jgi:uncharacterized protein YjcR
MAKQKKHNNEDKKALAYELYMNTNKTQLEICEIVGITPKTFSKWKQDGMWAELKAATTITAKEIERNVLLKLNEMATGDKPMNADAMLKLAKIIEVISEKRYTIAQMMNVFQAFTNWMFEKDADLAKDINKYQKQFVDEQINK